MTLLDLLTLLSYIALNVDILFQIRRIYQTKSSRDLSLVGMSIRYAAILIILIKFISISDLPLIIGQGLIVLTFTTYIALALYYVDRFRGRNLGRTGHRS
jgi:uncharacterized protein with PQ loop repeat